MFCGLLSGNDDVMFCMMMSGNSDDDCDDVDSISMMFAGNGSVEGMPPKSLAKVGDLGGAVGRGTWSTLLLIEDEAQGDKTEPARG